MQLVVADAETFVASKNATAGVAKGIARNLEIPAKYISVRLSISLRRMQASGNLRRLDGGVQVDYTITIPAEQSASYDVNEIAKHITDASEDDAASAAMLKAIQESVAAEDPNLPAVTAVTVTSPVVTQGSSDNQVESETQGTDSDELAAKLPIPVIVACAGGVLFCIMSTILIYCCCIRKKRAAS